MDKRVIITKVFFLNCLISFFTNSLRADDISTVYNQTIHLASGYEQLIKESPAAVSVITSEDIEKIGAITLEEIFETIPGIHVTNSSGFLPTYVIRGIESSLNAPVLIYLDGISINNSALSSSLFSLSHLVKNVDRIEIIKGPGSALYGADAYSGVINIITKQAEETEIGTFSGSFDTFGGWLNHGYRFNDFNINFSAQGRHTNGSKGIVVGDRQTELDNDSNTNASLAPAPVNRGVEEIDIKLSTEYKDFSKVYLRYIHNESQNGIGFVKALDNSGYLLSNSWIAGLELKLGPKDWQTKLNINYIGYVLDVRSNYFPKGTSDGRFLSPAIGKISYTAHDFSTQLSTIYRRIENHTLHSGIGFEYDTISDISDERNFIQGPSNTLFPTGSLKNTDELGVPAFFDSQERYNFYGFIQDEWHFLSDFSLTTGVRFDYFSDFGLTVNPRASLIWNMSSSLTTKIMYGRAFKTPSFLGLNANIGFSAIGNQNLSPETMQTVEWSIQKTWPHQLTTQLNLFWYETDDVIISEASLNRSEPTGRSFINAKGVKAYGLEFELIYQLFDDLEFSANYAYLKSNPKSQTTDLLNITSPRHQVYAAINWNFAPNWSANIRSTSILGRKRSSIDSRPSIKDYTQLNFVLHGKHILGNFDVTFKINNFLDANVREPSLDDKAIPGDYPLDGRSFTGIISMKF
jgi:iron complex outermembrane receptor protein